MRVDPTGHAWWHWAIAGGIVVGLAVATIMTCGGVGAAASAIYLVANGVAAGSTAATVTAGAFIGSSAMFATSALTAAADSFSLHEFAQKGDWLLVAAVALNGLAGGISGGNLYKSTNSSISNSDSNLSIQHYSGTTSPRRMKLSNATYTQYDNTGKIYSYTQFDIAGRQTLRIDFQGSPHRGVLPHIHTYYYPARGNVVQYVYDMLWNKL